MGAGVAKRRKRIPYPSREELWAEHERRVDRAIGRFRTSYMSNAKWRKALTILAAPELGVSGYRWKFVDDERVGTTLVVGAEDLEETCLRDGRFFPYVYREIEWLETETAQADEATAALARAGKFPIQTCDGGIRLLGYG